MKRILALLPSVFLLTFLSFTAAGQFTSEEIAQRKDLEEFLKTAEITGYKDIEEGVTHPIRLYLKRDGIERSGAWKNPSGVQKGFLEGWQYEIAAYEMDKLLGLGMIPPTVERKFKGKRGSLQLWIEHEMSDLDRMERKIQIPSEKLDHWSKMKYLQRAFDSLIANDDRTQQNIRYTKDWRMILIDHSRSFRSSKKYTEKLLFGKNSEGRPKLFRQLPRTFVEKVKSLNLEDIKKAVGPYLKDNEIRAVLIRKGLLLEEINEMIKEKGEDKVLY